jgi:ribosomal protein S18 acetylase RimI-like enzyme
MNGMMADLSSVSIRRVRKSDLPALEWDGEYTHFRKIFQHSYKEAESGNRILLIAEADGELIGQIFIHLNAANLGTNIAQPTAYLYSFRVRQAYRGMGVGSKLLSYAEETLREQGFQIAVIAVSKSNERALDFYQKWGFSVFREDSGRWSYHDHQGQFQQVHDPSYMLMKEIALPPGFSPSS